MSNIRWHVLTPSGCLLHVGGSPVLFTAPDKFHAIDYVSHRWPSLPALRPVSVVEWEVMQRDKSAVARFVRHADEWWARAMAKDREEREDRTGQLEMGVLA